MKTFIYSLLLIAFVLSACEDEVLIGTDTPINPERNEATIGAEGGTLSIKTETTFWLRYIYEYEDGVEKGKEAGKRDFARNLEKMGMTVEKIAEAAGESVSVVRQWLNQDRETEGQYEGDKE